MKKTKTKKIPAKKGKVTPELKTLMELLKYSSISEALKIRALQKAVVSTPAQVKKLIKIFEKELKERIKIHEKYEKKWNDFVAKQRKSFQAKLKKKVEEEEKSKIEKLRKKLKG